MNTYETRRCKLEDDFIFMVIKHLDLMLFGPMRMRHCVLCANYLKNGGQLPDNYYDLQGNGYYFAHGIPTANERVPTIAMKADFFVNQPSKSLFDLGTLTEERFWECFNEQHTNIKYALRVVGDTGVETPRGKVVIPSSTPLYFEGEEFTRNQVVRKQLPNSKTLGDYLAVFK